VLEKVKMEYTEYFAEVVQVLSTRGCLLASWKNRPDQVNAMTIGWGMIGTIWGRPVFQVLVRPSRYTADLLKKEPFFSVNVLPKALDAAVMLCGSRSGRNHDKLAEVNLTAVAGAAHGAPVIEQSVIHYECHIVESNQFAPEAMVPDIRDGAYPSGDYHRIYWGQILDCRVNKSAMNTLFQE